MNKEESKPKELALPADFSSHNSALAKLAKLPKVGSGLGGYDISLGFSHRYAIEIALDVLEELNDNEKNQVLEGIYSVFETWKNEQGVYPPNFGGLLFGLSGAGPKEPEPAREYIKRQNMAAALLGKPVVYIKPWECDSFARTPVRLFFKLFSEDYPPLKAYMEKRKPARYDYILATVIIMSHKSDSEYQSSDCIEGAFKLAQMRMDIQKTLIEGMEPLARETFNRKRKARIKREATKEETERKVIELHQKFLNDGNIPPYKEYAAKLGYSESTISRILKKNGFAKYKS